MENNNINIFDETKLQKQEESKLEKDVKDFDSEKYIKMAKERLASTYINALETQDISKLEDAKKQLEEIDKLEKKQGKTNYLINVFLQTYAILTNKKPRYESKSLVELEKQKKDLTKAYEESKITYENLNRLVSKINSTILSKNNELAEYQQKTETITKKLDQEKQELHGITKTIDSITDENYKSALTQIKEETELLIANLESELYYETETKDLSLNDRNMYLIEKNELLETIKSFEYNINFYKKEMQELDLLMMKHSSESHINVRLNGELAAYKTNEVKQEAKNRENQKVKIFNEAKEKQPSLLNMKKDYVNSLKQRPKMKR
ncbi:MAG: hypothetical protein PHU51_01840 [Candidatus Nanoarchaeia archaeon]|nr:hypothetical protein [Candidatus Nanoarchaeia archaeon]